MNEIAMGHSNKGFTEKGAQNARRAGKACRFWKDSRARRPSQPERETHVEAIGTMRHDGGASMRRDTIFRMASTSKMVGAAAVMVLLDECKAASG